MRHTFYMNLGLDYILYALWHVVYHYISKSWASARDGLDEPSTHTGRLGRSSVDAFRVGATAEHLLEAIPGGWAWRRVVPMRVHPDACMESCVAA